MRERPLGGIAAIPCRLIFLQGQKTNQKRKGPDNADPFQMFSPCRTDRLMNETLCHLVAGVKTFSGESSVRRIG